jgi:hypothetical protein
MDGKSVGVRRGVSKGVKDGRRPPRLQASETEGRKRIGYGGPG